MRREVLHAAAAAEIIDHREAWPSLIRRSTVCDPMKPAPPVFHRTLSSPLVEASRNGKRYGSGRGCIDPLTTSSGGPAGERRWRAWRAPSCRAPNERRRSDNASDRAPPVAREQTIEPGAEMPCPQTAWRQTRRRAGNVGKAGRKAGRTSRSRTMPILAALMASPLPQPTSPLSRLRTDLRQRQRPNRIYASLPALYVRGRGVSSGAVVSAASYKVGD